MAINPGAADSTYLVLIFKVINKSISQSFIRRKTILFLSMNKLYTFTKYLYTIYRRIYKILYIVNSRAVSEISVDKHYFFIYKVNTTYPDLY